MKDNENKSTRVTFFINDEKVASILEQLPKGVRSMFIEQAILEYSSKKPKVEFFFHGITKTRRINKVKQQDKNSEENNLQSKISKENNVQANINELKNDNKAQKKSGGMMFNFSRKE
ncbi:hypothetical protein O1A23_001606 [Campylobacter coli]|nr:hypothetical protein [Campylobacter jejuni]EJE3502640.1 hypothetical protein [Campylobacter coli]EAH8997265.1 hypothetical protein [Campylobacter jejuni]EAH9533483.1 hypothetical protein [Campylobacter jejuni]EAI6507426.1 hypothetical protein [Campylobacter jejuni]